MYAYVGMVTRTQPFFAAVVRRHRSSNSRQIQNKRSKRARVRVYSYAGSQPFFSQIFRDSYVSRCYRLFDRLSVLSRLETISRFFLIRETAFAWSIATFFDLVYRCVCFYRKGKSHDDA